MSPAASSITTDRESSLSLRNRAASFALFVTVGLTLFKLAVASVSGSVGVLSEAIHSFLDLISAAVSFFTVREAGKPADLEHPYGHGKIETLSSLFEALLLVVAGAWICKEALEHFYHPQPIRYEGAAIIAITVSMVVSFLAYRHNLAVAERTSSPALRVNALHFLSDVVASGGILFGLLLLHFTGWYVLDAVIAFCVALYIFFISGSQVRQALFELSDSRLSDSELRAIESVLTRFRELDRIDEAHDLRTRRSGAERHLDFHLVVCRYMTVEESHAVCDEIELELLKLLPGSSVNIHVEPCEVKHVSSAHCQPYARLPREKV